MRERLASSDPDSAARLCVDALAFSREASNGGTLIGAMFSASGTTVEFTPCAAALDLASENTQKDVLLHLRRIREGIRPLSSALPGESIYMPLLLFGSLLSPDQLNALPSEAQDIVKSSLPEEDSAWHRFVLRHAWLEFDSLHRDLASVVDLPKAERDQRFIDVERSVRRSLNPIVTDAPFLWGSFADRIERQRAQLDLLTALVEADVFFRDQGHYPRPRRGEICSIDLELLEEGAVISCDREDILDWVRVTQDEDVPTTVQ